MAVWCKVPFSICDFFLKKNVLVEWKNSLQFKWRSQATLIKLFKSVLLTLPIVESLEDNNEFIWSNLHKWLNLIPSNYTKLYVEIESTHSLELELDWVFEINSSQIALQPPCLDLTWYFNDHQFPFNETDQPGSLTTSQSNRTIRLNDCDSLNLWSHRLTSTIFSLSLTRFSKKKI